MTQQTAAPDVNAIAHRSDPDSFGWHDFIIFGADNDRGWTLECDMEDGALTAAFTPAGLDTLFLMTAKPDSDERWASSVVQITVEAAEAHWNPATRTLTIWNGESEPEGLRDDNVAELLAAARAALAVIEKHIPPTVFAPRDMLRAAIAKAGG